MPTQSTYRKREAQAIEWLSDRLGIKLRKQKKLFVGKKCQYKFDGVSVDNKTIVEVRANDLPSKGSLRDTQLAETSEACLFMLGVKEAERRILALTQKKFYEAFMQTRQACLYRSLGIEIEPPH